jgi:uncharacterized protein (UPF0332 family)
MNSQVEFRYQVKQIMRHSVNWLFELRSVGDYGVSLHVGLDDARRAAGVAEDFFKAAKKLLSH